MEMIKQTRRLLSLDVLRGITVAGMILVNDPGSWGAVYAPLCHAYWNGLTPTDLVFPFFMFIMGVSMFFSLRKYDFIFSWQAVGKILKRFALIFLIGLSLGLPNGSELYVMSGMNICLRDSGSLLLFFRSIICAS